MTRNSVEEISLAEHQFSVANYFLPRPTPYHLLYIAGDQKFPHDSSREGFTNFSMFDIGTVYKAENQNSNIFRTLIFLRTNAEWLKWSSEVTLSLIVKAITNKMNELHRKTEK